MVALSPALRVVFLLLAAAPLAAACSPSGQAAQAGPHQASETLPVARYARLTDKPFADVLLDMQFIISRHNFAITGRNRLGQAVRRRGHAEFPDAMVVNFCNVDFAREAIAIDPALMVYMPCKATLLQQGEQVLVQTLLLPTGSGDAAFDAFARRINAILREVVDYAVEATDRSR